uniref:Uncharacterized protein n=1 Tax=Anopheles coluzzii TaxID=1518534 RepID=A0A8W7PN76_ANOCL
MVECESCVGLAVQSSRRWGKANRSPEYVVPGPVPPKADTIAPQPQPDRDRPGHKDRTGDPDAPGELLPTTPLSNVSPIASYLRRAAAAAVPRRRTKAKVRYGPLLPILAYSATPTGPCTPDDFRVSADDPQCLVLAQGVAPANRSLVAGTEGLQGTGHRLGQVVHFPHAGGRIGDGRGRRTSTGRSDHPRQRLAQATVVVAARNLTSVGLGRGERGQAGDAQQQDAE